MYLLLLSACLYDRAQYLSYLEEFSDDDRDGYPGYADCDDDDPEIHPEVDEYCDGVDNDCDGMVDNNALDTHLWYQDLDSDTYGNTEITREGCTPPVGYADNGDDCNDDAVDIYPNASESCDVNIDQNCDGLPGNLDADGDGVPACEDCEDTDAEIAPNLSEICDGKDNNCSGEVDEQATDASAWYPDADGDGFGTEEDVFACERPDGFTYDSGDCDDHDIGVNPSETEVCDDGLDNDCDGTPNGCRPEGEAPMGAVINNNGRRDYMGVDLQSVGDINVDGYDDLMISALDYNQDQGANYLILGPIQQDIVPETDASLSVYGEAQGSLQAGRVGVAGDLNGDGIQDLYIGSADTTIENPQDGAVYLVSSDQRGARTISEVAFARLQGQAAYDYVGLEVVPSGDMSGDGYDDILLGAYGSDANGVHSGAVYIFYGPLTTTSSLSMASVTIYGKTGDQAGQGMLVLDADGDGVKDFLMGATFNSDGGTESGAIYIFLNPSVNVLTPENADTTIVGAEQDGIGLRLRNAGDTDGDGIEEVWTNAVISGMGGNHSGSAFLFDIPNVTTDIRTIAQATLVGEAEMNYFGMALSILDLDDDGTNDVFAGAPYQAQGGTNAGKAYLFYGPFAGIRDASTADWVYIGSESGAYAGEQGGDGGDLNHDGYRDLLVSETGADQGIILFGYAY